MMANTTIEYRLRIIGADGSFVVDDDVVFPDRDRALAVAKAIVSSGSLSADPGDRVTVEEVCSTLLFSAVKPDLL